MKFSLELAEQGAAVVRE